MQSRQYQTITAEALENRMKEESPNNVDEKEGYALVNVLGSDAFDEEHIRGSINIPKGKEDTFEDRFSKDKEIVVYCASTDCDASPKVAKELADRGFTRIVDFEAGMDGWKRVNGAVESAASA